MTFLVAFHKFAYKIPYYLTYNTNICDLFFGIGELNLANYADDNMPYTFSAEFNVVLKILKKLY